MCSIRDKAIRSRAPSPLFDIFQIFGFWLLEGAQWLLDMPDGKVDGPAVAQAAADAVRGRLEREGRSWLPEVLCLCDDYLGKKTLLYMFYCICLAIGCGIW